MDSNFRQAETRARKMGNASIENNWPKTNAPQQFTQYPVSQPYTNPPIVVPGVENPPKGPPISVPAASDEDARAAAGTGDDADFRTDLSQYNLVVVREKDVPNVAGYNPQSKLKYYPKGKLPGSNETFYLVTHAFANKSNINEVHRGYVNIKADPLGKPTYPLMAYINNLGLPRSKESATGTGEPSSALAYTNTAILCVLLVVMLFILYNLRKKYQK